MADARHHRGYPKGPRLQMTPAWKARVLAALAENAKAGREPANPTELSRVLGADKAGIHKMLLTEQQASKYVRGTCKVLGLEEPMVPVADDEW